MIKLKHRFFLLMLFCCLPVAALQADPSKVALVIGNSNYLLKPKKPNFLPILPHPLNDAHDMADKLGALGFDVVARYDIKKDEIDSTLNEFQSKLNPGTLALIFYAGHGLQIKGENYFPAVDADISSENDVPHQSLSVKQILYVLAKSKTQSNLIFLDACRDNPFNSEAGLARVIAPIGTLIFYSTRPGSVASDGGGRNGLYTNKLLKQMDSHQQIEQSLKIVAREVKAAYALQEPWQEGGILGNFCFAGCEVDTPVLPPQEPISAGLDSEAIELSFWDRIKNSSDAADFQAYLSKYPIGQLIALARNRLIQLASVGVAKPAPITQPTTPPTVPSPTPTPTNAVNADKAGLQAPNIDMVKLPTGISMGKYEVTQGQWKAVMGNNPSLFPDCGETCPVERVSYNDIQQFLQRLNSLSSKPYRLPTEEEWFSACQAGSKSETDYCGSNTIDAVAWYDDNSNNTTHPVGQKQPNAYELYDMSGNVWEWTSSLYEAGESRLTVRGGSWYFTPAGVRSAFRFRSEPTSRSSDLGFRLAQDN